MKVCKQKWELEIDTKTNEGASLGLQTMVVLSTKLPLKVMHPK